MMYKISDFKDEVIRRTMCLFQNHLFLLFFIVFIVVVGTFGIWVSPIFVAPQFDWNNLKNSFNTLNLLAFTLPLLVTLVFDKIVTVLAKGKAEEAAVAIWFSVLFVVVVMFVGILFVFGYKSGSGFTWPSFFAWLLVLYVWILGNVDNPNYQKSEEDNAASGGPEVNRGLLKRGG
ncbi:hypothetical protein ACVFI8_06290 [Agarivorans sp. MS3-6]